MTDTQPRLQHLLDRQEILDCLNRYCLGLDRHDPEMTASAFHPDALAEHGPYRGGPAGLVAWANAFHAESFIAHTHSLTTHGCDIDGDVAHAHSYCLYGLRRQDGATVALGCARYIDRLERREGAWRIAHRRVVIEWRGRLEADLPGGYEAGSRDRGDPSYQRPLRPLGVSAR